MDENSTFEVFKKHIIEEKYIQHGDSESFENLIEALSKKTERIVFGVSIGKDCENKTVADALITKLYSLIGDTEHLILYTKEEAEKNLRLFLETWDQDPALTEEEKKSILDIALVVAKQKRSEYLLDAEKHKKMYNEWNLVKKVVLPEQKHTHNIESLISVRYNKVINLLQRMAEMQKNNDNVM